MYVNILLDIIYLRRLSISGVYLCICIWHVAYHTFVCLDIHDIYIYVHVYMCVCYTLYVLCILSPPHWHVEACLRGMSARKFQLQKGRIWYLHCMHRKLVSLVWYNWTQHPAAHYVKTFHTHNHAQPRMAAPPKRCRMVCKSRSFAGCSLVQRALGESSETTLIDTDSSEQL